MFGLPRCSYTLRAFPTPTIVNARNGSTAVRPALAFHRHLNFDPVATFHEGLGGAQTRSGQCFAAKVKSLSVVRRGNSW